jgi:CheY-like chemotaxis protein
MKTVLFADDNRRIREYCRAVMEDEGYRVVLARDGMEAIGAVEAAPPDLAILDISMPGMNGLEALERIKQIQPDLPVLLFTSFDEECVRDRRGCLATACVEKREDLTELKRAVASALKAPAGESPMPSMRLGLPPIAPRAPTC